MKEASEKADARLPEAPRGEVIAAKQTPSVHAFARHPAEQWNETSWVQCYSYQEARGI